MKDLEDKLHQQFPEAVGKTIEIISVDWDSYDDCHYEERLMELEEDYGCSEAEAMAMHESIKTYKLPQGYLIVTTTDNTLYLVKV